MKVYDLILSSVFCLVIAFYSSSCGRKASSDHTSSVDTNPKTLQINVIKVGGVYLSRSTDGGYHVIKILVEDSLDLYIRFYSDKFAQKPNDVQTDQLTVFISQTPMSKAQFVGNSHELVKVEPVAESELEGYKNYKETIK